MYGKSSTLQSKQNILNFIFKLQFSSYEKYFNYVHVQFCWADIDIWPHHIKTFLYRLT